MKSCALCLRRFPVSSDLKPVLVESLTPVKRLAPPHVQFLRFFGICICFVLLSVVVVSPRTTEVSLYFSASYLVELLLVIFSITMAGVLALRLGQPGYKSGRISRYFFIGAVFGWPLFVLLQAPHDGSEPEEAHFVCGIWILLSTLILAPIFWGMIKKGAPVSPVLMGVAGTLACSLIGGLILHIICPSTALSHIFIWHVAPSFLIPAVLLPLYGKIFRW